MWLEIKWWGRWLVRYFPVQAYRRLTDCRKGHVSLYDGFVCIHCGAPWFGRSD